MGAAGAAPSVSPRPSGAASAQPDDLAAAEVMDLTGDPQSATTAHPGRARLGVSRHHPYVPRVATHAPAGTAGADGDLGDAMNASGGGAGVGKDAVPPETRAPSANAQAHPSLGQVQAALMPLLPSARACFAPDSPPTQTVITFGSDGSVKSVTVSGFARGKPQEACVRGMLLKARVDPFSDPSYSVPYTVRP